MGGACFGSVVESSGDMYSCVSCFLVVVNFILLEVRIMECVWLAVQSRSYASSDMES